MSVGDPVNSLAESWFRAIHIDLTNVEYVGPQQKRRSRRPYASECGVVMFEQMWGSTALGFGGIGGAAMSNAYTVVVTGPNRDVCVYFNGRLAYHIDHPNRSFYEDIAAMRVADVKSSKKYETEAVSENKKGN